MGRTAIQNAVQAETMLKQELERDQGDAQIEAERLLHEQQDAKVATNAAALQDRLSEMHGGSCFDKVAFRRQQRQPRFVRLSFDLRRIEWGQHEQGPMKALPVEAILRIDFGDASRTFRSFEFAGRQPPLAGQCLSISTPSRSLDLIARSERDVEIWVLGLNEIVPYRPERQRLTAQDFLLRRAILRLEAGGKDVEEGSGPVSAAAEGECDADSTTSSRTTSVVSSAVGRGGVAFRRMLPGRWT